METNFTAFAQNFKGGKFDGINLRFSSPAGIFTSVFELNGEALFCVSKEGSASGRVFALRSFNETTLNEICQFILAFEGSVAQLARSLKTKLVARPELDF